MFKPRACALLAALLALSGCLQDSKGEKAGSITRLSRDGWIPLCKTGEGELIRGGIPEGSGVLGGAPFHFTVRGSQVEQVRQALESRKEVKIKYHHEAYVIFGKCSSKSEGFFLDEIEIIN